MMSENASWNTIICTLLVSPLLWYYASTLRRVVMTVRYGLSLKKFHWIQTRTTMHIKAHDGIRLATTILAIPGKNPVILIRTPYRRDLAEIIFSSLADQGYNMVIQDCRGRFESEGTFEYMKNEDDDAVATLEWIGKQPWFDGNVGMFGISYLGCVQWAAIGGVEQAKQRGISVPRPKAFVNIMSSSDVHRTIFSDNSFNLDLSMRYAAITNDIFGLAGSAIPERTPSILTTILRTRNLWVDLDDRVRAAGRELDIASVHRVMRIPAKPSIEPNPKGDFWSARTFSHVVETAPRTLLVGGWYDMFIRETLRDWEAVQRNGLANRLIVGGPWTHYESLAGGPLSQCMHAALDFFLEELRGIKPVVEVPPVRLFIMGPNFKEGEWRSFDTYPPAEARPTPFYLGSDATLGSDPCLTLAPAHCLETEVPSAEPNAMLRLDQRLRLPHLCQYVYDPHDPTPVVGGAVYHRHIGLQYGKVGPVDNALLESRRDVMVFTSEVLVNDLVVVGPIRMVIYARSSTGDNFDIFGRICDVDPAGRSLNVCDGLKRQNPVVEASMGRAVAGGPDDKLSVRRVEVDLWATGKRFAAGHRIRLLVSSGAHCKWIRNYGTSGAVDASVRGEPLPELRASVVQIFHDKNHPSAVYLPVLM